MSKYAELVNALRSPWPDHGAIDAAAKVIEELENKVRILREANQRLGERVIMGHPLTTVKAKRPVMLLDGEGSGGTD